MVQRCIPLYLLSHIIMPWCLSDMTSTSLPGPTTCIQTSLKNHPQLSLFSFSTKANAKGTNLLFASQDMAIRSVLVFANQEHTINGEDGTIVPKGLDTLREALESTEEYLPPILPCIWFWDVLIMHAWIHRFDCIKSTGSCSYPSSQSPYIIFHARCLAFHALP